MCSLTRVSLFCISLLIPLVFTLANPCASYFPLGLSVTNTSLIPHTLLLPQVLSTDGYTPGNEYTFTIETEGPAKINTFFLQVQTQDSTPVGTFVSLSPSQSVISCHGENDSLIDAFLSADQNLTSLSVTWTAHSSAMQLTNSLRLVYTLGVNSLSYQRYRSQPFSLKDFCSPSPCQNSGSCQRLLTGGYSCVCPHSYFGLNCQHFNACATSPCLNMGSCSDQLFGFKCSCPPGYTGRQCEVNIDECQMTVNTQAQHPCMFNGTCIDGSNSFSCECRLGYAGDRCETNIDDCTAVVCGDSGSCKDLVGDYVCSCEEGAAGRNCEISHECSSSENLCLNNAVCIKNGTTGEITCVCHSGFTGDICSTAVNHCVSDLCRNGATCHSLIGTYLCDCLPGWEGMNCDVDINECSTAGICNNGICVNTEGSFECFCSNGFAGELCDSNLPDCYNNLCSEYSTCVDGIGEYTCACPPGRTGIYCDTNVDLCLSNPCRNNASCIDGIFSHRCDCTPGYTGASCEIELNECESSPCLNNGICVDRVNAFECMCREGFAGLCCEVNLDDCVSEPCENGGTCNDGINDFTCDCIPGFTSKECAEDVDECLQLPCLNNATCSNAFGSFACDCQSGFAGDLCGSDINECDTLSQPCLNGGSCINTVGNYTCQCPLSYKGFTCQIFVPSCDNYDELGNSLDCDNNGTCILTDNVVTCQCKPGFTGMFCETPFDPCIDATCSANSSCVSQGFSYTCICPPGVTGDDCDTDVMECESNICENNGSCMELFGSFICMCGELFSGQRCEIPLNFCEISQPCINNGNCSSSQPGTPLFNCTCPLGYIGETCDRQINYCESNPCSNNGNCTTAAPPILSGTPVFTCSCPPGYTGVTCSDDIDECPSVPCSNNATCLNQHGGYSCDCTPGFTGDRCEQEILECQILTPCLNNGTCIEMVAGYVCKCAAGYSGENCSDKIDFCMDSPCNTGSCVSLDDGYRCICPQGVTGSQCATDIPECASQPCMNNGICEESFGSFACLCPSGFSGTLCEEEVNNCVPNPCVNEGICVDSSDSFECFCRLGYTGDLCHIDINDCSSSPCLNGGTCVDGTASFSCECTTGYTGPICSLDIDSCQSNPCKNNGTCIDLPNTEGYMCNCIAGYTGVDCGEEVDECAGRNCSNNGHCLDLLGNYSCLCDKGFSGRDCETKISMCSSSPCANNGTCVEVFPFFECMCTPGFTGEICQTDINDCANNPCQQGSTCVDGLNEFMCLCPDGFTGTTCQSEIFECTSSPCINNGTCVEIVGTGFMCVCGTGYTGDICQFRINFCETQAYMTNPCANGNCVSIGDIFICMCEEGYTGDRCENRIPSICVVQGANSCSNNGTCVPDPEVGFKCICSMGYTGERCENEINECITLDGLSPCLNGNCIDLEGDFYCVCTSGYTGRLCDTRLNVCVPNPCIHGVCRTVNGQFLCLCFDGYSGDLCEVDIDDCVSSPCQNNATCLDKENGTDCNCIPGYTGRYCENRFLTCDDNPCLNEGVCINDPIEGYRCICPIGVTGDNCDIILTFCREGSCLNGAMCVDVQNGFQCVCPTGFTGERCEYLLDFCASTPCANNATCSSGNASFSCFCPGDYFGVRCQYFNNCVGFDCNYGECVNIFNSTSKPVTSGPNLLASGLVSCVCLPGYTGQLCEFSLDACVQNPGVCSNRGTCISTGSGEYRCECGLGYAGGNCQTEIPSVFFTESSFLELLPIPNPLNQYTIDLSMQTNDSSALLLYTAQDTSQNEEFFDFLLIQIISGQVRVTFDCGSGPGTVQTNFDINDGKVHSISIVREGRSIQLTVDGRVFTDLSAGGNTQQTLSLPLFIGGVSNYSILPERFRALSGFTGCVHTISVSSQVISLTRDSTNAVGLQTCQESSCGYVRCQNGGQCVDDVSEFYRCICPDGYRGNFCEVLALTCTSTDNSTDQLARSDTEIVCYNGGVCKQVGTRFMCVCVLGYSGDSCQQVTQIKTPLFSGEDSFLVYTSFIDLSLMFDFSFSFRPLAPDGIILYSSQFPATPVGDYALLQLHNGYIQFIFDCGSGRLALTSSAPIALNTWHSVRVVRVGRVGQLYVNSQPPLSGSSLGAFARLNLAQNLYIGGFDSRAVSLPSEIQHSSGLVGCIEQFNSSLNQIMLSEATDGLSISSCPVSQCNSSHCLYGGSCLENVSRMNNEVSCSCLQGYGGERCQNIINVCSTDNPCQAGGICQTTGQGNAFICLCPFGKDGQSCEEDLIPILPKLSAPHSFLQYPLIPHISLEIWNKIEFSFTFDFSTIPQAESTLRNLVYFGSEDSSDFIALVLDFAGATPNMQLHYNLGSGIQTAAGPYVQQGLLYAVSLTRYQRQFTLSINGNTVLQTFNPGLETALDLPVSSAVIVIGALSPQLLAHTNSPSNATGVRGCLHALTVNLFVYGVSTSVTDGLSISDCLQDICINSQPCLNDGMCVQSGASLGSNIVCLCRLGFIGDNCAQEISITTASFASYSSLTYPPIPGPISDHLTIVLPIKLDTLSGKILLVANQLETEFIRLELIHGVLALKSHLGEANSIQSLLPSRWYNLTIVITTQKISVLIDGGLYFELVQPNRLQVITRDTLSLFTLGTSVLSQQSFQGCIGNVTINHDDVTVLQSPHTAIQGRGVSQCVFSRQCSSSVCAEHGVCSLSEELSYSCNCYEGFTGETCEVALFECDNRQVGCVNGGVCRVELVNGIQQFGCICQIPYTGDKCQYKSTLTSVYFNSNSYLGFPSSFISSFKSSTVIELVVMPDSGDGVLFFAQNIQGTSLQDYMYIGMRNSKVEFRFDLGTGTITLISRQSIQLGKPISIRAQRNEQVGELYVDSMLEASGTSPGSSTFFAVNTDIYLGGVPNDRLISPFGSQQGFQGCIGSFKVGYQTNTIPVAFNSATSGIDIRQC